MSDNIKNKMDVRVLQYFDYSIMNYDEKNGLREILVQGSIPHYCIIPESISNDKNKIQDYIVSKVKKECIADIAMVVVYHFVIDREYYDMLNAGNGRLKGDDILLDYFTNVVLLPNICKIEVSYPIVVNDTIPRKRIYH